RSALDCAHDQESATDAGGHGPRQHALEHPQHRAGQGPREPPADRPPPPAPRGAVFWVAQTIATVVAMVFNFTINNVLTYSDDRLRGGAFYKGLLLYSLIASVGIVANVSTP